MIINFEDITYNITEYESKSVWPEVESILSRHIGLKQAITNDDIVDILKRKGIKTSGPRVRKLIHIMRVTDTIKRLMATSKGYYISNDIDELKTYIQSLDERMGAIAVMKHAIKAQIEQLELEAGNFIEIKEDQLSLF